VVTVALATGDLLIAGHFCYFWQWFERAILLYVSGLAHYPIFHCISYRLHISDENKKANRRISSIRVVIEHIISGINRCRIVKDVFRNTKEGFDDSVIECCFNFKFNFR